MQLHYNGNGDAVNGRGLRHRKLNRRKAVELAADIASGRPYTPSLHDLASIFGVSAAAVSQELKARTAVQKPLEGTIIEEVPATPVGAETVTEPRLPFEALLYGWRNASSEEHERFVRTVGVDAVWDVIARLIR